MTSELTLPEQPSDERRDTLFEALDGADPGEEFEVVAGRDVDPDLVAYQVDRGRSLTWEHAHPDAEPREVRVVVGEPLVEGEHGTVDVRDLKPQRRHEALLQIFDELDAGEGFVLVNDHDPKPLYHELRSMHGDVIDWEYASRGDGEWRVTIEKTDASDADDEDVVTKYDVRDIPKPERHPTIHHRYGMIPEGGTMELVAPHEPRPLKREFHQQYGDTFAWEVVESEPGRCRVRITKGEATDGAAECGADDTETPDEGPSSPDAEADPTATVDADLEVVEELDVRDRPPAERHERIYEAYDDADAGEGFVLVNDHDPEPLYHQFEAEAGPEFRWEYRQKEPGEFRVLIGKAGDPDGQDATGQQAVDGGADAPF